MRALTATQRRLLREQRRRMLTEHARHTRAELLDAVAVTCDQQHPDALDRVLQHRWWIENSDASLSTATAFARFRARNRLGRERELEQAGASIPTWADTEWLARAWATMQEHDDFDIPLDRVLSRIAMIGRLVDAGVAT